MKVVQQNAFLETSLNNASEHQNPGSIMTLVKVIRWAFFLIDK